MELKIDPEFRDKIPPLTDAEFEQLEENILADGEVYEPICVWNGTIVDGHNRWKIVQEHPEIPYRTREMDFADKWEAFEWMYKKQLGRRNLSDEQRTMLMGNMLSVRKKRVGAPDGNKNRCENNLVKNTELKKDQKAIKEGTAGEIAKELGVSEKTVRNAEKFAEGIDALEKISKEASGKILNGGSGVAKKDVMALPYLGEEQQKKFAEAVISGNVKETKQKSGFTSKMREQKKLVDEVVSEMYSPEVKPFSIEMLEGDIELNGRNYIELLRSTLIERSTLLVGENRKRVAKKIDEIINEIQKIRRLTE